MSDTDYGGFTEVASCLQECYPHDLRQFSRQAVYAWWSRRKHGNGFPEQHAILSDDGRIQRKFKIKDVLDWYEHYVPDTGRRTGKGR